MAKKDRDKARIDQLGIEEQKKYLPIWEDIKKQLGSTPTISAKIELLKNEKHKYLQGLDPISINASGETIAFTGHPMAYFLDRLINNEINFITDKVEVKQTIKPSEVADNSAKLTHTTIALILVYQSLVSIEMPINQENKDEVAKSFGWTSRNSGIAIINLFNHYRTTENRTTPLDTLKAARTLKDHLLAAEKFLSDNGQLKEAARVKSEIQIYLTKYNQRF